MRTTILTFFCSVLLLVGAPLSAQNNQEVLIRENNSSTGSETTGPRMPESTPITCRIYESIGYIGFTFSYDFGEVDITIENLDTSSLISVVADTADGYLLEY